MGFRLGLVIVVLAGLAVTMYGLAFLGGFTRIPASTVPGASAPTSRVEEASTPPTGRSTSTTIKDTIIIHESPPSNYSGTVFSGGGLGLTAVAELSAPNVSVGEKIWISVSIKGENASRLAGLVFTVTDPEGRMVYRATIPLIPPPSQTGAKEIHVSIAWRAAKSVVSEAEVRPGTYSFTIESSQGILLVKGTIRVVGS